ncbi:MAG TPA: imidazolonepropionase [Burkholderiales bacterium]|nr:imidazolonepropionase [Burkholderiales bacterium]
MVAGPEYGAIHDGAIAVRGGRIAWVGARADLPAALRTAATREHDAGGRWITPGLIDCHTHLVYAGSRAGEFEQRLNGASYEAIARAGGGIRATVAATRAASEAALLDASKPRLKALAAEGVTTVEIKSGYGLETGAEAKMLRVARALGNALPVTVRTSFLGAHALPPEFDGRADAYIDEVCGRMLPELARAGLVDAVDAFCERIGFSVAQTERMFEAARRLGLPVKLHAEQLSNQGGARLAARYGALSADHVEYIEDDDAVAMARAGTVAVLLPGAFYFLRETRVPPVDLLRRHGVAMAVATDCNPGTSPMTSLLLALNMACTLFRLTPQEALAGATREAARALGLAAEAGTLEAGKIADFVLWDIERPAELAYGIGVSPCHAVVKRGIARTPAELHAA